MNAEVKMATESQAGKPVAAAAATTATTTAPTKAKKSPLNRIEQLFSSTRLTHQQETGLEKALIVGRILVVSATAGLTARPFWRAKPQMPVFQALDSGNAPGLNLLVSVLADRADLVVPAEIRMVNGSRVFCERKAGSGVRSGDICLYVGAAFLGVATGKEFCTAVAAALAPWSGRVRPVLAAALQHRNGQTGRQTELWQRLAAVDGRTCDAMATSLHRYQGAIAAQVAGAEVLAAMPAKFAMLKRCESDILEENAQHLGEGRLYANLPQAVLTRFNKKWQQPAAKDALLNGTDDSGIAWLDAAIQGKAVSGKEKNGESLLLADFAPARLVSDFAGLCAALTLAEYRAQGVYREGLDLVDHQQMARGDAQLDKARKILDVFFNKETPERFLLMDLPSDADMRSMGLQPAIDWLRNKLVDLRELERLHAKERSVAELRRLGRRLLLAQISIDPAAFRLRSIVPDEARELALDSTRNTDELGIQIEKIHRMFFLRIWRALALESGETRARGERLVKLVRAYGLLEKSEARLGDFGRTALLMARVAEGGIAKDDVKAMLGLADKQARAVQYEIGQMIQVGARLPILTRGSHQNLAGLLSEQNDQLKAMSQALSPKSMGGFLRDLSGRCEAVRAIVWKQYSLALAELAGLCMGVEKAHGIKPLRLVSYAAEN